MASNCELYDKYFDGCCQKNLSASDKDLYSKHVDSCEYCTEELESYQKTLSLVDSVTTISINESFWARQHNSICSAVGVASEAHPWVAPRYLLVLMLVMVGAYVIDGVGFLYVSGGYQEGVKLISNTSLGQYFDPSFLVYGMFVLIGINSFVSESRMETVAVAREA